MHLLESRRKQESADWKEAMNPGAPMILSHCFCQGLKLLLPFLTSPFTIQLQFSRKPRPEYLSAAKPHRDLLVAHSLFVTFQACRSSRCSSFAAPNFPGFSLSWSHGLMVSPPSSSYSQATPVLALATRLGRAAVIIINHLTESSAATPSFIPSLHHTSTSPLFINLLLQNKGRL